MDRKIKIAYIIPTLDYGGAERQLINLCLTINENLFETTIITLTEQDALLTDAYPNTGNIRILKMNKTGSYNILKLWELKRLLHELKPDIIHTILPTANFWGCLAARLFTKSVIVASSRGLHKKLLNKWALLNCISFRFLADRVIVNSETVKENCINLLKVKSDLITKINNGIFLDEYTIQYDRKETLKQFGLQDAPDLIISTAGRLDRLKAMHLFILAADLLTGNNLNVHFLVAGKGPCKQQLIDLADRLGLKNISFLGHVSKIKRLLAATGIFVLPTLSEGCSNVILEAMASELPIVTTDIPANSELIENNTSGLLVETNNPKSIADAVMKFIDDPQFAKKCAKNARTKANRYEMHEVADCYERFYESLVPDIPK